MCDKQDREENRSKWPVIRLQEPSSPGTNNERNKRGIRRRMEKRVRKLEYWNVSDWSMDAYCCLIVDTYRFSKVLEDDPIETDTIFEIMRLALETAKLNIWDKF